MGVRVAEHSGTQEVELMPDESEIERLKATQ
jgi:hypothetical protein